MVDKKPTPCKHESTGLSGKKPHFSAGGSIAKAHTHSFDKYFGHSYILFFKSSIFLPSYEFQKCTP